MAQQSFDGEMNSLDAFLDEAVDKLGPLLAKISDSTWAHNVMLHALVNKALDTFKRQVSKAQLFRLLAKKHPWSEAGLKSGYRTVQFLHNEGVPHIAHEPVSLYTTAKTIIGSALPTDEKVRLLRETRNEDKKNLKKNPRNRIGVEQAEVLIGKRRGLRASSRSENKRRALPEQLLDCDEGLRSMRRRYGHIKARQPIWDAIDALLPPRADE